MDLAAFGRFDLLPRERGRGLVGAVGGVGSVAAGVWVSLLTLLSVVLVVSCVFMSVVVSSVSRWWSDLVAASVSPDVGRPPTSGRRWSCWLAWWCVRATVSGFARGAFGDLGVSFVASALLVGGVCRMVSESGCRVSAVRFCPERLIGVIGGVRNVVSACVLSAEFWWLESFPWVMVLGGVATVGCAGLPAAGCAVWVCAVLLWSGCPSSAWEDLFFFCPEDVERER